jgi:hypothetical protein
LGILGFLPALLEPASARRPRRVGRSGRCIVASFECCSFTLRGFPMCYDYASIIAEALRGVDRASNTPSWYLSCGLKGISGSREDRFLVWKEKQSLRSRGFGWWGSPPFSLAQLFSTGNSFTLSAGIQNHMIFELRIISK